VPDNDRWGPELIHTKGHAAPETKASLDQAYSLIERANALGEAPEDPLLLFSAPACPPTNAASHSTDHRSTSGSHLMTAGASTHVAGMDSIDVAPNRREFGWQTGPRDF
jgi:hypothetical protein